MASERERERERIGSLECVCVFVQTSSQLSSSLLCTNMLLVLASFSCSLARYSFGFALASRKIMMMIANMHVEAHLRELGEATRNNIISKMIIIIVVVVGVVVAVVIMYL